MSYAIWALIIGVLLTTVALSGTVLRRFPVSMAMLYLAAGYGLGPAGWNLLTPDPLIDAAVLERVSEGAVLISLFAVGLRLGLPLAHTGWRLTLRLAVVSMCITVALVAAVAVLGFGLPLGAAILLGAILAPTDPVLASDVQVIEAGDRDRLRFCLTSEGGLNDGAAFPFVMLGLGLLGLHDLGTAGWHWLAFDVIWASGGGLVIGGLLGTLIGRLVVYLRAHHQESFGLDEFLALGLVALAYGLAVLCLASGFLAVFAAGLALQRVKENPGQVSTAGPGARSAESTSAAPLDTGLQSQQGRDALATHAHFASAYMMQEVQGFNARLERIAEMAIVMVVGAMISRTDFSAGTMGFALALFLVIRPVSVWLGLRGAPVLREQRLLISWFGIRGIGSIFYVMYATNHGLSTPLAAEISAVTLTVVTLSIVLHGMSVTPLMDLYTRRKARKNTHK